MKSAMKSVFSQIGGEARYAEKIIADISSRVILLIRAVKLAKFSYTLRKTINLGESWSFCNLLSFTAEGPSYTNTAQIGPRRFLVCKS